MNELMIVLGDYNWIYFPTAETTADSAFKAFCKTCDTVSINIDNMTVIQLLLRDANGKDIDIEDYT